MNDLEDRVRSALADERWDLPPHLDPRPGIASKAANRRRLQLVGAATAVAGIVVAVNVIPWGSAENDVPAATDEPTITAGTDDATAPPAGTDPTRVPVKLESVDFRLVPGQVFDLYNDKIKLEVLSPMCRPVDPGSIEPQVNYEPGELRVTLYAVSSAADDVPGCLGGLHTSRYTIHLLEPLYNREVVLDHTPPDNPPDAVAVPDDVGPGSYVDPVHPDRAHWTSTYSTLMLWAKGTAKKCDPETGYLSLLFPADGTVTFEPTLDDIGYVLPANAIDTGWRAGPVQLWVEHDYSAAYLVVNGVAEKWLRARDCVTNSFEPIRG